jgi:hypothetical protein
VRLRTATSAVDEPEMPAKKHAEQRHHLRQAAAQMSDHGLRQPDHAVGDVGRGHQLADQQEEGHRQQDL